MESMFFLNHIFVIYTKITYFKNKIILSKRLCKGKKVTSLIQYPNMIRLFIVKRQKTF